MGKLHVLSTGNNDNSYEYVVVTGKHFVYLVLKLRCVAFSCSHSYSIFGSVEIFNLDPDKVSTVQIWLMQNIGGPPR